MTPVNQEPNKIKLTILEAGEAPEDLQSRFGTFPDMFKRLLSCNNYDPMEIKVVSLIRGESLPPVDDIQALLITGSRFSAYDELPWRNDLEKFIQTIHAQSIPMVGVCFGHQIIAQALGGKVEKVDKGWGLGRHVYSVLPGNSLINASELGIACSHQDQVTIAPKDATAILFSSFTPNAGLLYENGTTFTLQPHPEFEPEYAYALCEMREGIATDRAVQEGKESLKKPMDSEILAKAIRDILKSAKKS